MRSSVKVFCLLFYKKVGASLLLSSQKKEGKTRPYFLRTKKEGAKSLQGFGYRVVDDYGEVGAFFEFTCVFHNILQSFEAFFRHYG